MHGQCEVELVLLLQGRLLAVEVAPMVERAGALGCGISGSGPSIFALSRGREIAEAVGRAMSRIYDTTGIDYDLHVSEINPVGVRPV